MISAEELLAGATLTYDVEIPDDVRMPGVGAVGGSGDAGASRVAAVNGRATVRLRPLTVHDLQLISRAAKENDSLLATLMVQRAMVEPAVTVAQVSAMHVGLVEYLVDRVNAISGITASSRALSEASHAPLSRAAFILAREFGWTPEEVGQLTLGQVLLHLEMLKEQAQG